MRLEHEPHATANRQMERLRGTGSNVHDEFRAAIHSRANHGCASLERRYLSFEHIARADSFRPGRCQKDISRTNRNADVTARRRMSKRHFKFAIPSGELHPHQAVRFVYIQYGSIKQILEASGLRQARAPWGVQYLHRRPLTGNVPVIQSNDAFSESVDLFAVMCDVQDRNLVRSIPYPKIFDDPCFQVRVEARERLIQKQHTRPCNQ